MCWNTEMCCPPPKSKLLPRLDIEFAAVASALGKARMAGAINKLPIAIKICVPTPWLILTPAFLRAPA